MLICKKLFLDNDLKKRASKRKVLKLTNDELFYDPNMDDEDEKWVERQRQAYHNGIHKHPFLFYCYKLVAFLYIL